MNSILFFNGDIITMEETMGNPEAVYVKNGKIKRVGNLEELKKDIDKETIIYDLKGKTLMPGFIDSHSHLVSYAKSLSILSLENSKNFKDIQEKIKEYIKENNLENSEKWIVGFGYDNNFLEEKKHPTKSVLDEVAKDIPMVITHISRTYGSRKYKRIRDFKY